MDILKSPTVHSGTGYRFSPSYTKRALTLSLAVLTYRRSSEISKGHGGYCRTLQFYTMPTMAVACKKVVAF